MLAEKIVDQLSEINWRLIRHNISAAPKKIARVLLMVRI